MFQHREQIHAVFALVAERGELAIAPRRRIDEPTPACGLGIEPDGVARSQTERGATEVGDADVDAGGEIEGSDLPAGQRFAEQRLGLPASERLVVCALPRYAADRL